MGTNQKTFASILPTVAISLGSAVIGEFETNGKGVQASNIGTLYNNYSFTICLRMLTLSFFFFLIVGLYFDNVLPSAYGVRKPWYFCISRRLFSSPTKRYSEFSNMETQTIPNKNFEPVSREL